MFEKGTLMDVLFCAHKALIHVLSTSPSNFSQMMSEYRWTDPGTRIFWGPSVAWEQPVDDKSLDLFCVAIPDGLSLPDIPSHFLEKRTLSLSGDFVSAGAMACASVYKNLCEVARTKFNVGVPVLTAFILAHGEVQYSPSQYYLHEYLGFPNINDYYKLPLAYENVCLTKQFLALRDNLKELGSFGAIHGANHAATLCIAMLRMQALLTRAFLPVMPGGGIYYNDPYTYGLFHAINALCEVEKSGPPGGVRLYVAPLPDSDTVLTPEAKELLANNCHLAVVEVRYFARKFTYSKQPMQVDSGSPSCVDDGLMCDGFSYKDEGYSAHVDAPWMFGVSGSSECSAPYEIPPTDSMDVGKFPLRDFNEEGLAKYLRLTRLMSQLEWGNPDDSVFFETGSSWADWASRPSNLLFLNLAVHNLMCINHQWDGEEPKCPLY
jgi:hypothetical protein